MRFSEAMRLGAMLGPQVFNATYHADTQGTCAMGAIYLAMLGPPKQGSWNIDLPDYFFPRSQACPSCGKGKSRYKKMCSVIVHLNDKHRWTRERIAAWLETIEPQDSPDPLHIDAERDAMLPIGDAVTRL